MATYKGIIADVKEWPTNLILTCIMIAFVMMGTTPIARAETEMELCQKTAEAKKFTEAIQVCQKAAAKGHHNAKITLSYLYFNGLGVDKDVTKAIEITKSAFAGFQKDAENGDIESQIFLGDCHAAEMPAKDSANYAMLLELKNTFCKQNYIEAAEWYRKAAGQGSIVALNKVLDIYGNNEIPGGDVEIPKLRSALRKAAERGDVEAMVSLGEEYYIKRDYEEALKWFRKAAENGDVRAQRKIDGTYKTISGQWVEKDKLFLNAEKGNAQAQYHIGFKFNYGSYPMKQDFVEALIWYEKSALQGNSNASLMLAKMYEYGSGVKQDYEKAEYYYRSAAIYGNTEAQLKLGLIYASGQGVVQNYVEAAIWFRKAAEQGDDQAQVDLGRMYYSGQGVPRIYQEAARWYQKAAEQGNVEGQALLGLQYATGLGVPHDQIKALAWINHAASAGKIGELDIIKFRDDLENNLKPAEIEKAQQLSSQYQLQIDKSKAAKLAAWDAVMANIFRELIGAPNNNEEHQIHAKLSYSKITLPTPTKPAFTTNDIAVIIGIEKYRTVPPTEYAAADAGMVRDYLKALGIPERNIEFLADERATLSDIRKVIETKLPNMVKANSRVIVYYAGHGASGTTKGESYLVPYDGDPSFLADTAYPLSRLYDRLSRLKAKEVLVILDSCFSGAGGRSVLAKNIRPLVMVKDTPPPSSKKMIVLTSSRGSQITTSLSEVGHGAFTYFFLRALQEGNRDIGEVYAYLNPRVTEEAKRQNVDQTPTISPAPDKLKGRFLFAR